MVTRQEFVDWRSELDAVHREMDEVIRSAWLHTAQERENRRTQFLALIERRNAAARKFLQPKRQPHAPARSQQLVRISKA